MNYDDKPNINRADINCAGFEDRLTDYLDGALERETHKAFAAHALACPLCHALLNEVKEALQVCHEIAAPKPALTKLEGRILAMTMPETAMVCQDFENHLTDYLDGFLPAAIFHRWERHAVLCDQCTDLPGEVVRSIAACYTYKNEELPLPEGLHARILQATSANEALYSRQPSWISETVGRLRSLSFPVWMPQLAPVAMMFIFAVVVLMQMASADGSIGGMYQKSFQLAELTYKQGAVMLATQADEKTNSLEPIQGDYVNEER